MPFWVAQKTGPLVNEINAITDAFRKSDRSVDAQRIAYNALESIYHRERGATAYKVQSFDERTAGHDPIDEDYMITIWFPLYANMPWSDGKSHEASREVQRLEARNPGTRYEVCYEY